MRVFWVFLSSMQLRGEDATLLALPEDSFREQWTCVKLLIKPDGNLPENSVVSSIGYLGLGQLGVDLMSEICTQVKNWQNLKFPHFHREVLGGFHKIQRSISPHFRGTIVGGDHKDACVYGVYPRKRQCFVTHVFYLYLWWGQVFQVWFLSPKLAKSQMPPYLMGVDGVFPTFVPTSITDKISNPQIPMLSWRGCSFSNCCSSVKTPHPNCNFY